jgi:hypothetical protein
MSPRPDAGFTQKKQLYSLDRKRLACRKRFRRIIRAPFSRLTGVHAKDCDSAELWAKPSRGLVRRDDRPRSPAALLGEQSSSQEYGGGEDVIAAKSDYMRPANPVDRRAP